jgi:hypothetical protein
VWPEHSWKVPGITANHNNIAILPWEIQGAGLDRENLLSKRNCQFPFEELAIDHESPTF